MVESREDCSKFLSVFDFSIDVDTTQIDFYVAAAFVDGGLDDRAHGAHDVDSRCSSTEWPSRGLRGSFLSEESVKVKCRQKQF